MFSIIVALGKNNEIGAKGMMPWHLPQDLAYFKKITTGHTIIMGRKTFESFPGILPNRNHIILSQDSNFKVDHKRVHVCNSLNEIINPCRYSDEELFIIGGGRIYEIFLSYCKKLYLTHIDSSFECDTYFPQINYDLYQKISQSDSFTDKESGISFCFSVYELKSS